MDQHIETMTENSEAASESLKEEDANILEMASQQETTGNLYTESAHRYYSESSYSSYTFTMLAVEFWLENCILGCFCYMVVYALSNGVFCISQCISGSSDQ